jgi:hypothetical protein
MNTNWRCKECKMPLCKKDRSDRNAGRTYSCLHEHKMSHNKYIGCGFIERDKFILPEDEKAYKTTRAQAEKTKDKNEKKAENMRQKRGGGGGGKKRGGGKKKSKQATEKSPVSSPVRKKRRDA